MALSGSLALKRDAEASCMMVLVRSFVRPAISSTPKSGLSEFYADRVIVYRLSHRAVLNVPNKRPRCCMRIHALMLAHINKAGLDNVSDPPQCRHLGGVTGRPDSKELAGVAGSNTKLLRHG